jgi:hypothetical protein
VPFAENVGCLYKKSNNGDDALETYPKGLSQVPHFFVICFYHRITMQKTNASNVETWRCQKLLDLSRISLMMQSLTLGELAHQCFGHGYALG